MLARRGVGPKPRSRNSAKAWADLGPRDSGSLARVQWARKGPGAVWQASAARPAPIAAANRLSSARPSPTPVQRTLGRDLPGNVPMPSRESANGLASAATRPARAWIGASAAASTLPRKRRVMWSPSARTGLSSGSSPTICLSSGDRARRSEKGNSAARNSLGAAVNRRPSPALRRVRTQPEIARERPAAFGSAPRPNHDQLTR